MANLTITVPEELKSSMDLQADVNWSEVCRSAILVYLDNRRNLSPRLSLKVDRTSFRYLQTMPLPQLEMQVVIRNLMGRELTLDRILFGTTLSAIKTGEVLKYIEGIYVNKHTLGPESEINLQCKHQFDSFTMESLIRRITGSFNAQTTFTVFVDGIKHPLGASSMGVVPIDEWKEAADNYQKSMSFTQI